MIIYRLLVLVAASMFLLGAYFPVAILIDSTPSIHVYGLVLIGYPMWVVGSVCAGLAAWFLGKTPSDSSRMMRLAWVLIALNSSALILCLIWRPEGIS